MGEVKNEVIVLSWPLFGTVSWKLQSQIGEDPEVIRGEGVPRLHVDDPVPHEPPAPAQVDVVEAPSADPVELVGRLRRRAPRPIPPPESGRPREEPRLGAAGGALKSPASRTSSDGVAGADPRQDDPDGPQAGPFGQVEVGVVDAERAAAEPVAEPDPGADPLGAQGRGRRVARRRAPPARTYRRRAAGTGRRCSRSRSARRPTGRRPGPPRRGGGAAAPPRGTSPARRGPPARRGCPARRPGGPRGGRACGPTSRDGPRAGPRRRRAGYSRSRPGWRPGRPSAAASARRG